MPRTEHKPSPRARTAWKRLSMWYGADTIERKYGIEPPPSWCAVFDLLDRELMARVFVEMKSRHPSFPPTQPEFEKIISDLREPPPTVAGPIATIEQLDKFVLRNKSLTLNQLRGWSYLYAGKLRRSGKDCGNDTVVGVEIPPDPENGAPGYRVMVLDMQAEGV